MLIISLYLKPKWGNMNADKMLVASWFGVINYAEL